jgi:hypothetical protein
MRTQGEGTGHGAQRQTVMRLTPRARAAAASLPKATLKTKSRLPPGRRRSKRDGVMESKPRRHDAAKTWFAGPFSETKKLPTINTLSEVIHTSRPLALPTRSERNDVRLAARRRP